MKDIVKLGVVLGLICIIAAAALAKVYSMTKEPIAQAMEAEARDAAAQVLSSVMGEGVTIVKRENVADKDKIYVAESGGQPRGFAFIISTNDGYSGLIESMLGVDADGNIIGYAVVLHSETPGLGANIKTNVAWQTQLIKKAGTPRNLENTDWRVKKDGGEIDALTGATITPRAVTGSVKAGLEWFRDHRAELLGNAVASGDAATPPEVAQPLPEPTPDAALEEGGTVDKNLPAAAALPPAKKTPDPVTEKDLTE